MANFVLLWKTRGKKLINVIGGFVHFVLQLVRTVLEENKWQILGSLFC